MKTKTCSKCRKEKLISEFYKDRTKKDSHYSSCKKCQNKYYIQNKKQICQKHKKYEKKYYKEHRKMILKANKIYRTKNKSFIAQKKKIYYIKNKNKIKNYYEKYYQKNRLKIKKYHQKYQEKRRITDNNRRKRDIKFRLRIYLANRLSLALKGNPKLSTTIKLIGCSISQLKQHLENQFKGGMTWKNYGKYGWHIDHIKPCSSFDLSKPSEQKKCFYYTNLQPLWWKENIKKGNKL